MQVVARFDPPDAVERHAEWEREHADALAELPAADVVTDIGRAVDSGTFVTVRVADQWADRFLAPPL